MRQVKIFSGSSHPLLADSICEHLSTQPAKCELKKFSNGETSVQIGCSIRDQDIYVVQSGSSKVNDNIMELLIMISACKGGSANKITAVMPYFPYSRQSKKKSHRGAITARMIANLLSIAGVSHIITVDLHASQMQGFFGKPVDNLHAEPLIARWIRHHVPNWREAVVVSKNAGGTKRVTSLADVLKLNFGIVTTDKRRPGNLTASTTFEDMDVAFGLQVEGNLDTEKDKTPTETSIEEAAPQGQENSADKDSSTAATTSTRRSLIGNQNSRMPPRSVRKASPQRTTPTTPTAPTTRPHTIPLSIPIYGEAADEYNDERAQDVITGRLIQGHIVDDDYPSPTISAMSASISTLPGQFLEDEVGDPAQSSAISTTSSIFSGAQEKTFTGTFDNVASSDEEEEEESLQNPALEHMVTLVGNVKERTVLIMDDMIDKAASWIAAAETVVKRGGAKKVYCIATHGLFGDDCLAEMEKCECIDYIVVTNTYPIPIESAKATKKLVLLDISYLLSEAIRRNHYGESISALFQHYRD